MGLGRHALLAVLAGICSLGASAKPFPNTITRILRESPAGINPTRATYVEVEVDSAVPTLNFGSSITFPINGRKEWSLLSGGRGKLGLTVSNVELAAFRKSLPLRVTLEIPVQVIYPNALTAIVGDEASAIGDARVLTFELEAPAPKTSLTAFFSFVLDGKKQSASGSVSEKRKARLAISAGQVEKLAGSLPLSIEIHNFE